MSRMLKLTLQYDGTEYVGWQRQARGISIQGLLEEALRPIEGAHVHVFGAGRTDAGVHALAQIASISLTIPIEPADLGRALNAVLPADVRVVKSTTRTVHRIDWREGSGNEVPLVMEIEGSGFLRHMVRTIAGTLVQVGLGRWPAGRVREILDSRSRSSAGTTAPASGLFLVRVLY